MTVKYYNIVILNIKFTMFTIMIFIINVCQTMVKKPILLTYKLQFSFLIQCLMGFYIFILVNLLSYPLTTLHNLFKKYIRFIIFIKFYNDKQLLNLVFIFILICYLKIFNLLLYYTYYHSHTYILYFIIKISL